MSVRIDLTPDEIRDELMTISSSIACNLGACAYMKLVGELYILHKVHNDKSDQFRKTEWMGKGIFEIPIISGVSIEMTMMYDLSWWWSHPDTVFLTAQVYMGKDKFGDLLYGKYIMHYVDEGIFSGELSPLSPKESY